MDAFDATAKTIVWRFQELRVADFFSPRLSNAQRLPNDNTLISEGWFGRFFEVTAEGEIVWEYVNPYFGIRQNFVVNAVQRAYRYSAEDIAKARVATWWHLLKETRTAGGLSVPGNGRDSPHGGRCSHPAQMTAFRPAESNLGRGHERQLWGTFPRSYPCGPTAGQRL